MSDATYRKERIERLLSELKYEITRGMMEREIDEHIGFRFVIPVSSTYANGAVECEFRTRPVENLGYLRALDPTTEPRIKLVKG